MFFARLAAPEIASEGKQLHKAMTRRMSGIGIAPRLTWNVIVGAPMKRAFVGIAITCSLVGCGISQQQEIQMGQEYAQQINAQLPIVQDPELNRYINVLGDSIARLTSRGNLDWHFFIVDAPAVNAFAVPGGVAASNRRSTRHSPPTEHAAAGSATVTPHV